MQATSRVSHAFDSTRGVILTFAGRTRCFGLDVRILSGIFKRPGERMAQRLEYAPAADTVDTNEKILKKPAGKKDGSFDPAAYQRVKRLAKQPIPGGKPAGFDPQIPVS
jgi:hypothetical protein